MDIMEPGYKMLGATGTQYLNPDYIQPLPTTLDSKNSPLALLAQTCSSIGKDSGSSTGSSSSKLSLTSLGSDKKDSHHNNNNNNNRDGVKDTASSCKQRTSSDSPAGGTSSASAAGSRTSSQGQVSEGRTRLTDKASAKDCSTGRSSSNGGGGGDSSPKSSRGHSLRPMSSLVSLGSGSGKSTPSSSSTFAVTTGSSNLHRDYGSSTRGGSGTISSCPSLVSSKMAGSDATSGLLYPDAGYQDDFQKSGGLASSLLQMPHNLQEALRLHHEGLQSLQSAGLAPLPSSYPPLLFGHPLAAAIDPLMYSYSASLAAVHGLALSSHKLPALSPYVGYARVSTASGGSTLVPVCKDPYCATSSMPPPHPPHHPLHSGHSLPPAASATTPCPAGCTQCANGGGGGSSGGGGQDKSHQCTPTSMSTGLGGQFSSLYPSLSLAAAAAAAGLGANPLLGMAAAAHLGVGMTPYACSWLSGGEFCGKRFSKAEDLLQHLRTHASSGEQALPPFHLPGVPLPGPGFVGSGGGGGGSGGGAGGGGLPFTIPGSLSPSSILQQAGQPPYPRSLSPTSLLAASRYHPYKSPFSAVLPTTSAGSGALSAGTVSALDAYYSSPYALYGHRIGAATVGP